MMHDLPRLFDANGHFQAVQTDGMDPPMRELYRAVANTQAAVQQAEKIAADALIDVKKTVAALHSVETYIAANFKKATFHDEWRAAFTGDAYSRSGRR